MGRRNDHSRKEFREMALQATENIIFAEGLNGLSTRKIAKAIGYTVGSLYLAFRNLDDIIVQVNGRTLDLMHQVLNQATERSDTPADYILALGHAYSQFAATHIHLWQAVFDHHLPDGEKSPPEYVEKVERLLALVEEQLALLSPKSTAAQRRLAAAALWSSVHGACYLALSDKLANSGIDSAHLLVDSIILHYLAGFKKTTDSRVAEMA